jgi:hypothetical protein
LGLAKEDRILLDQTLGLEPKNRSGDSFG